VNLYPRERRELRNISLLWLTKINRTSKIVQAFLNTGFGLPSKLNSSEVNQTLHEVDTGLNLAIKAPPRNVIPRIQMTSIIEPEDLTSDVLQLIRMDPQSHDVVGETPYPNLLPPSKPRSTKLA
jgi:hypothetical protein